MWFGEMAGMKMLATKQHDTVVLDDTRAPGVPSIMKASLRLDTALRLIGTNAKGHETYFDTSVKGGGLDSAASPMEIVLEAVAACTAMDVIPIIRKRRKTITAFSVDLSAERASVDPKVFTQIAMKIRLTSPDATLVELVRAIELSQTTYCSVSTMIARGGCVISWVAVLQDSTTGSEQQTSSSEFSYSESPPN
jgi:putative redox protein